MQEEQCKFLTHRLNAKAKESFGKRPFCRKDSRFAAAPMCRFAKCCGCLLRKSVILLWRRIPRYGIITSKLPLARLRVCKAHVPVLTHRALRTLNRAKPQQVRFCCGRLRRHRGIITSRPPLTPPRALCAHEAGSVISSRAGKPGFCISFYGGIFP